MLQPGNQLDVVWRARLPEHMGSWTAELRKSRGAAILSDPLRLAALQSVCSLCSFALPEREGLPRFQARTEELCDAIISGEGWLSAYVFWEVAFLEEAGLQLDLKACAVSGNANDLAFVSPRTGRAVSRSGAGEWASRLLPLPEMLIGGAPTLTGVIAALDLTGFFLEQRLAPSLGERPVPPARARLAEMLRAEV